MWNFDGRGNSLTSPDFLNRQLEVIRDLLHVELIKQMDTNIFLLKRMSCTAEEQSSTSTKVLDQKNNSHERDKKKSCTQKPFDIKICHENKEINKSRVQQKNETKNIPKNYGKALLTFIEESPELTKRVIEQSDIRYPKFLAKIRKMRKSVKSIEGLRKIWGSSNYDSKIQACIRKLSYIFMRKHCLQYIFNSKVRNLRTHIKCRKKLLQALENPAEFTNIKDY